MYCWPRSLRSGRSLFAASDRTKRRTPNTVSTEIMTKAMICTCQVTPVVNARMPMTTAASPNHRKCTPGTTISSVNSTTARISQFQTPKPKKKAKSPCMSSVLPQILARLRLGSDQAQSRTQACGTLPWRAPRPDGAGWPPAPFGLNASLVISASPASDPITAEASSGIIRIFWFGDLAIASSAFT